MLLKPPPCAPAVEPRADHSGDHSWRHEMTQTWKHPGRSHSPQPWIQRQGPPSQLLPETGLRVSPNRAGQGGTGCALDSMSEPPRLRPGLGAGPPGAELRLNRVDVDPVAAILLDGNLQVVHETAEVPLPPPAAAIQMRRILVKGVKPADGIKNTKATGCCGFAMGDPETSS